MSASLSALVESALQSVRAAKALAADAVTSARASALGRLDAAFTAARSQVEAASRDAAADQARQSGEADDALTARLADGAADLAAACNRACASLEDAANAADAALTDRADAFLASPANDVQIAAETAPLASQVPPPERTYEEILAEQTAALDDEDLQAINGAVLTSKAIMEEAEGLAAPPDEQVSNRLHELHEALPEEVTASAANGPEAAAEEDRRAEVKRRVSSSMEEDVAQPAVAQPEAAIDEALNGLKNRGAARKPRQRKQK